MNFSSAEAELLYTAESRMLSAEAERIASVGSWWRNMNSDQLGWSDGVFRIFGVSRNAFEPTVDAFRSMVHPLDLSEMTAKYERTLASGEPFDFTHRIVRADGEIRHVHERAQFTTLERTGTTFLVGAVHDITNRRHLQKTSDAALAAVQELCAPLTSVLLCVQAMRKLQNCGHSAYDETIRRALNITASSAEDLAKVVRSLNRTLSNDND